MTKGVPENKIEVIYNWVDEKAIVPIKKKRILCLRNLIWIVIYSMLYMQVI